MVSLPIIDFVLHIDKYLNLILQQYGLFTYFILFLIIFLETGLVIAPFLPGDSLLFVVGALAAGGSFNLIISIIILSIAAILGDTLNYFIGSHFGKKIFTGNRFFKPEYLEKTKAFYEKHGKKTIIYARFIPVIRTFAPFIAGIGRMPYMQFLLYNVVGGIVWVTLFLVGGYFFGNFPIIKNNLSVVIVIIILISFVPPLIEYLKSRRKTN